MRTFCAIIIFVGLMLAGSDGKYMPLPNILGVILTLLAIIKVGKED